MEFKIIKFIGKVTYENVDTFIVGIDELIVPGFILIADISEIDYADSYLLGTLIRFHRSLEEQNAKFFILNDSDDNFMTEIFNVTCLYKILRIVKSIDEVKEKLNG